MKRVKWLDRSVAAPGPRLTLCITEDAYKDACKQLGIDSSHPWIAGPTADATAHVIDSNVGVTVIVCISGWEGRDPIEVCGMLIHEAVHVWQEHIALIGEKNPGNEQEAYAIQMISQNLLESFAEQTRGLV